MKPAIYSRYQRLAWMAYTLYSGNKSKVAEIAAVDLNKYGKIDNPVSEKAIICEYQKY